MKLVLFNDFVPGVLKGGQVVDVSGVVADIPRIGPQSLMSGLIERFGQYRPALERAADESSGVPVNQVRLRAPLPEPGRIVCMAGNYMENATRALGVHILPKGLFVPLHRPAPVTNPTRRI